jgi:hypothetical protein
MKPKTTTFRIGRVISDGTLSKEVSSGFLQIWHSDMRMEEIPGKIVKTIERVIYPDSNVCICPPLPPGKPVIIKTEKDWYNFLKKVV